MIYINIVADTCDADYVGNLSLIDEQYYQKIQPVIQAIKDFKPYVVNKHNHDWTHKHNFPDRENVREDLGELSATKMYGHLDGFYYFYDLIPRSEMGISDITEITIIHASKVENLL